jgi:hypothetical protein
MSDPSARGSGSVAHLPRASIGDDPSPDYEKQKKIRR